MAKQQLAANELLLLTNHALWEREMAKAANTTGHPRRIDLAGQKFGRWSVLHYQGYIRGMALWRCRCECGNEADVPRNNLRSGKSISCGCYRAEDLSIRIKTHGASGYKGKNRGPLYVTWVDMRRRCYTSTAINFPDYGARGITVCDRWRFGEDGKTGYECFVADMGPKPSRAHTIERKEVNGNYEPGNCEWATRSAQARNKRNNRWVMFGGERMILQDAIKASGIPDWTVRERMARGWPEDRALTQPVRVRNWRKGKA